LKELKLEPKGMSLNRLLPAAAVAALVNSNKFHKEDVSDSLQLGNVKKVTECLGVHMNPPPSSTYSPPPHTHSHYTHSHTLAGLGKVAAQFIFVDKLLGPPTGGACLEKCFSKDSLVEFATPRSKKRSSKPSVLTKMLQVKQLFECYHSFEAAGGIVKRLKDKSASWNNKNNLLLWAAFVRLCGITHSKWKFDYHTVEKVPPVAQHDICIPRPDMFRGRLKVTDGDDASVFKNNYAAGERKCRFVHVDAPETKQAGLGHVCKEGHYRDIYNKDLLTLLNQTWMTDELDENQDRPLLESVMNFVKPLGLDMSDIFDTKGSQVVPRSTNAFSKFVMALWLAKGLVEVDAGEDVVAVKFRYVGKDPVQGRDVMELMEAKLGEDGVPKWRSLSLEMLRRGVIYGNIMGKRELRTREDHMERENFVQDYAIANKIGRMEKVEGVDKILEGLLQSETKVEAVELLTDVLMSWPVRQVLAKNLTQEHPGLYKRRVHGPDSDLGGSLPVRIGTSDDAAVIAMTRSKQRNQQQFFCIYCHDEGNGHLYTENPVTPGDGGDESEELPGDVSSDNEAPRRLSVRPKPTSCENLELYGHGSAAIQKVPCWLPVQVWRHLTDCAAYAQKEKEYSNIQLHLPGKAQSILNWNVEKAKAKPLWQESLQDIQSRAKTKGQESLTKGRNLNRSKAAKRQKRKKNSATTKSKAKRQK
jgi:hypothetical protein